MPFAIDDHPDVVAHWSADQITGLSDGDPVDTLPESIDGWDLTGATTTRPLYRPTSAIASLPAVEYDGTDDFLVSAVKSITVASPAFIAVVRHSTIKNWGPLWSLSTSSGVPSYASASHLMHAMSGTSALFVGGYGGLFGWRQTSAPLANTTNYLVTGVNGDWNRSANVNGKAVRANETNELTGTAITAVNCYASFGQTSLSGSRFHGLLAEMVFFNEGVNSARLYIEGVLAHKYGITLPAAHPYYAAAPTEGPATGGGSIIIIED